MLFRKSRTALLGLTAAAVIGAVVACTKQSGAKEKPRYTFSESAPAGVMVTIDGKNFNEDELMGDDRDSYAELFGRLYEMRNNGTDRLLLGVEYGEAAKKANVGVDEYVETKVLKGDAKISDSDYNKFVKEKNIPKEQLNPQLKERILAYMKNQKKMEERDALVVKLSKKHKVVVHYPKPNIRTPIEIGDAPFAGSKDAKVKIVEFSDFQCPFCGRAAATVEELRKIYGKKIQLAFKQYPLPMHPQARPAAEASLCVNEQGTDKFWKYHDKLFANQDKLDDENLKKFAKEVGANVEKFSECYSAKKFAARVDEDLKYGSSKGVNSTPAFYINGIVLKGAQPIEKFREIIDEELGG